MLRQSIIIILYIVFREGAVTNLCDQVLVAGTYSLFLGSYMYMYM